MISIDGEDWPGVEGVGPVLEDAFLGDPPAGASNAHPLYKDFLRQNGAILYDTGLFDLYMAAALQNVLEDERLREATAQAIAKDLREHYPGVLEAFEAAVSAATDAEDISPPLCEPDGKTAPYLGKRTSGPIDEFLRREYPFQAGAPRLTLQSLGQRDAQAYRALYNQLDEAGRQRLGLAKSSRAGDELLATMGLDLTTEEGVRRAKRVWGLLQSRLYPRRRLDIPQPV